MSAVMEQAARVFDPAFVEACRREKARRSQTSLLFIPGHPLGDLLKPYRYKVYKGGRGGARSWTFAEAAVRLASGQDLRKFMTEEQLRFLQLDGLVDRASRGEAIRFLCCREFQNSITDSVHKLLSDTIERLGMEPLFKITDKGIWSDTGSEFIFKGLHNNTRSVKSTEGVDVCWVEEADSVSKESWKDLVPTIRGDSAEIWIGYNPNNESDPTHVRFGDPERPPARAVIHHINYDSNPFFPAVLEEERLDDLRRVEEADNDEEREQAQSDYDHVWLGHTRRINNECVLAGKTVVQEFAGDLWRKAERVLLGADWGFARDPTALTRSFIVDKDLYVEHEAGGTGVEFEGAQSEGKGELERLFDTVPGARDWVWKGDAARPETISFVKGRGIRIVAAEKWPGSVEDGITHLRGFRKIVIHPRCKRTIEETKLYKYKVDRVTREVLPVIVDKHNHYWDSIRYALDGFIQKRGGLSVWERLAK